MSKTSYTRLGPIRIFLAFTLFVSYMSVLLGLFLVILVFLFGCAPKDTLVLRPGSPVLITEVVGHARVRVSAYSKEEKKLVDIGVVELSPGWTLTNFDWASYVEKHRDDS